MEGERERERDGQTYGDREQLTFKSVQTDRLKDRQKGRQTNRDSS